MTLVARSSVATELYPIALQQARFEALISSAVWIACGAVVWVSYRGGIGLSCWAVLLVVGFRPTMGKIKWWHWLKHETPEEALLPLLRQKEPTASWAQLTERIP